MMKLSRVIYLLTAAVALLIVFAFGFHPVGLQAQTPTTATPVAPLEPADEPMLFDPIQMGETIATLLEQMQAMRITAPDEASRREMTQAMMKTINGMMGLNQSMMDRMPALSASERAAMAPQMMQNMNRMTEMMGQIQPMTGTMPMSGTMSMGMMDGDMMPQMMAMMGQMMQMMGQMHPSMMDGSMPMTGTMPMSGTMSMGMMDGDMMPQMMAMMGQMMQMMGQMHPSMMDGDMMNGSMTERQAEVAKRGVQVMPFDLEQTLHLFQKTDSGGLQQVVVKEGADDDQTRAIQLHLRQEAENFGSGDFASPAQIHGNDMPGLAILSARFDELDVQYTPLDAGAQLEYISDAPDLIAAIHAWFDAQVSDHGRHATDGMASDVPTQSTAAQPPAAIEVVPQSVEGGGVTVKVTPLTLTDASAPTLDFEVVLDTHSVELDYDLSQLAVLRDELDNEYQPTEWTTEQSGGHHVSGLLRFADRAAILQSGISTLELDIAGIASMPSRIFAWRVGE